MNDLIEQEVLDAKEVSSDEPQRLVIDSDIDLRAALNTSFHQEVAQLLSHLGVIVDSQWRPAGLATEKIAYGGPVLVIKAITGNQDVTGPKLAEAVRSLIPDKLRAQTRVWCPFFRKDACNETLIFDVAVAGAPAALFEGAEEDEMKTISEPTDPKERIITVLNGHGLHIESFVTTPEDPGWGELGNPVFVIKTNLQPTQAEWTYDSVAQPGLIDFCERVKRDLQEITRQSVSFATQFSGEKGAWEITWLTDEHKKLESTGDEDLDAEIAKSVGEIPTDRDIMPSGIEGWQSRLQSAYDSFEEFASYSDIYGLAERLGFESAQAAWEANPIIRGSVNPEDYGVVEGIRAYHASPNKFKKFDLSKEGAHFGTQEQAANVRKHGLRDPMAYDLEIRNPLRLHDIGVWNNFNNLHAALSVGDHITPEQADEAWAAWLRSDAEGWAALKGAIEKNGYDSIVYQNEQEGPGDSYLVFRDDQIRRLKEDEDEGDFKEVWVDSPSLAHTFKFIFDFGAGEGTQEWVWTVPIEVMPPVGPDGDLEPVLDFVKQYARQHMPDTPADDWDFLVDVEPANPEHLIELLREDLNAEVVSAAKEADKNPTDDQKEAGNYQKGHVVIQGLDISIENAKGSMRRGKDKDGKEWEVELPAHYGYIKGTEGKDKDHIDVFIGENPESERVFVVNQDKLEGGFDEHKVLLGFDKRKDAVKHYDGAYTGDLGPKLRGSVVSTTMEKFQAWLKDGDHKKPFKEVKVQEALTDLMERVSISDVFAYLESIRSKLDEARDAAAAREQDPEKKEDILKGHGTYMGSCGHRIQGCRCARSCGVIEVQAPCRECAQKAPIHEFANKWRSQKLQEATDPEHMFQSREYDCGPTCIKMVANSLGVGRSLTLDDIIQVCGSDPTTGTDDKKMEKGLAAAGVPFKVGAARTAEELAASLQAGNLIILRTLTRGIKHWIVLYRFDGERFLAQDPWLGPLSYTPEEVVNIWKPRDYFYFEVPRTNEQRVDSYQIATYAMLKALGESQESGNLLFVNATGEVMPALEKAIVDVFPRYSDWVINYAKSLMDPQLSIVVLDGHEVVGFYLIGRRDVIDGTKGMEQLEDLSPYAAKRGVEGVALGVVGSARGRGIGNRLKDYPKHLGVDYVWGLQMKELHNLKDWLKRRRLVAQSPDGYATLEDL